MPVHEGSRTGVQEVRYQSAVSVPRGSFRAWTAIAIASMAASILVYAREAGAEVCPAPHDVAARINPVIGEISRNDDIGLAEIRRQAGARKAAKHFPLLGMSVGTFALGFTVDAEFARLADGRVCAVPKSIDLHIGYVDRTLFIAREARRDECVYRQVLEHDLRHARMDDDAVTAFIPVLRRSLGPVIKDMVSAPAADERQAKKDLERRIQAALSSTLDSFETMRLDLLRSLDSEAELARLREGCHGRARNIEPEVPSGGASETHNQVRL